MSAVYPARFTDRSGREETTIHNDGTTLHITLRGVRFEGDSFDDFMPCSPEVDLDALGLAHSRRTLCSCEIACQLPITVWDPQPLSAQLHVRLVLGDPRPNGGIEHGLLYLELALGEQRVSADGPHQDFEAALLALMAALPPGVELRACISCALSDYSPYGQGLFGGMACFRSVKAAYGRVDSKQAIFDLWDQHSGFVQETHCCPEYQRRQPGAGYRG